MPPDQLHSVLLPVHLPGNPTAEAYQAPTILMLTYAVILILRRLMAAVNGTGLFDFVHSHGGNLKVATHPVGVHSHMCRNRPTTLVLKEPAMSIAGVRLL